ncbi:VPLPA-CTERM sorting domain-containing protein [Tropicimonas sp. IMCC6043]|nr:VPLPA-CTERM sorting domain-containing protein [Tropicimonas sp. IMCC6043]
MDWDRSNDKFAGSVLHDDGISAYDDGVLVSLASAADPTRAITTEFLFNGGDFRLIYAAANGNPEVLSVTTTPIPLPAGGLLLLSGLGGFAAFARRRKAA